MIRKIDLIKAIRTFLIVSDKKSFSQAARELDLVVSAVSRQVSDLEEHFNCQLLYRTTRAMHLTAEGSYYLEEFKELVDRLEALESRADQNQEQMTGHIRITAPPNAERLGVTKLISKFAKLNPAVKITTLLVNRYVNLIEEGIDLAIRVHELQDSRLVARRFADLKVMYVANPSYLKEHGLPKHPKELIHHNCVTNSTIRTPGRWRYFESNKERHVNVTGTMEVSQGSIAAEFSAAGHGIAFLPDFLVQPYLNSGELISILEPFQGEPAPVSLVYPSNRLKNPALNQLVRFMLDNNPN